MWDTTRLCWIVMGLSLLAAACPPAEATFRTINDAENCLDVRVGPDDPEAAQIDVTDGNGSRVVGTLTVTPGAGPVNTVHLFQVDFADEGFAAEVDRVLLISDNNFEDRSDGGVGTREFEMLPVPGLPNAFDAELTSGGEDGEQRTDRFCVEAQAQDDAGSEQ
jgi:hypothetical protein